jgi:hypothetical protein
MSLTPFFTTAQNGVWRFFGVPDAPGLNQPFRWKMSLTPFFQHHWDYLIPGPRKTYSIPPITVRPGITTP